MGENLAKTLLSLWFGSANVDSRSAIANLIRNWINGYKEVDLGRWSANLTKPYCNQSFKNREKDSSQSRWNEIIQNYLNNNQKTIFFYLWELIGSEVENNEDGNIILIRELLERKAISTNNDDMKNILQEMRIFDISTDLLDKVFIHSAYTIKNGSKAKFKVQDIVMPRGTDWICDLLKTLKNSAPEYSDKLIGDIDPQNHETLIRSVIKRHMIKKGGASLLAIDEYGIITPRVMLKTNESIEKVIFRHPTYDKAELIKLLTLGEDFSMWENFLGSPSHRWRIDTLLRWFDFQTDPFKYKQ